MMPTITTFDHPPVTPQSKTIMSKDGFTCSLILLSHGEKTRPQEVEHVHEHILYIAEGRVTVRFGTVNTILSKDQSLLVPKKSEYVIEADPEDGAKILRVEFPPRQLVTPQIITLSS